MKKIAFVFAFTAAVASSHYISADYKQQSENIDPWRFIEYKLITSPQSLSKKGHLLRFIPASLIGVITGVNLNLDNGKWVFDEKSDTSKFEWFGKDWISQCFGKKISNSARLQITTLASTISASLVYGFVDIIAQHVVDWYAIHTFVMQWPEYKKYTPTQLQPIFDDVYEMYLFDPTSTKYHNNAADAFIIAREYIEGHFPEKYGKSGAYKCTKYIARQILNSAPGKMIINTLKLFV